MVGNGIMKHNIMKITCLLLVVVSVFLIASGTAAPTITSMGDLGDWGLTQLNNPGSDWTVNETWIPFEGIYYIVEDNFNPLSGASYKGVHISGAGSSFSFYNEPKVMHNNGKMVWEPYGYEPYDLEAIYFTQNNDDIYVAIITSIAQEGNPPQPGGSSGGDRWPGDLALNFRTVAGEEFNCEYGVKLNIPTHGGNYQVGDIVYLPKWQGIGYVTPKGPDIILGHKEGGGVVGQAIVHYNLMDVQDEGYPNYFVEISIPKNAVGVTGSVGFQSIQYYDNCLNDHLFVPEFPAFSLLIGLIFGIAGVVVFIKTKK